MGNKINNYAEKYLKWVKNLRKSNGFISGMGSIIDLSGEYYNHPIYSNKNLSSSEKDSVMIASDWKQIGKDLSDIIGK